MSLYPDPNRSKNNKQETNSFPQENNMITSRSNRSKLSIVQHLESNSNPQNFVKYSWKSIYFWIPNWTAVSYFLTFWAPEYILNKAMNRNKVQPWREKVALCIIIAMVMLFVGYFTIGMRAHLCSNENDTAGKYIPFNLNPNQSTYTETVRISGKSYNFTQAAAVLSQNNVLLTIDWINTDITQIFDLSYGTCSEYFTEKGCSIPNRISGSPNLTTPICLTPSILEKLTPVSVYTLSWSSIQSASALVAFNSKILNLTNYNSSAFSNQPFGFFSRIRLGHDITKQVALSTSDLKFAKCLASKYVIAQLDSRSPGCTFYYILMITALTVVIIVITVRFLMALLFHWGIAPYMARRPDGCGVLQGPGAGLQRRRHRNAEVGYFQKPADIMFDATTREGSGPLYLQTLHPQTLTTDLHTICMVTCYSEDETAIRQTLDSLAHTDYPDTHKLLFVICDGLVHGAGNSQTTPDIVISMIDIDLEVETAPVSYLAIADGANQENRARVYAGKYYYRTRQVPIIVVVKCGNLSESMSNGIYSGLKPGNRGKRDSQLILMHFLSRVTFNDRMTALDYDIFRKVVKITGVTADQYQVLLMVDADTVVNQGSLRYMVHTMVNDDKIMGLCGDTRISNKWTNWVTAIQVYEYFTNHNLGKAFESVFGGVQCLPGCFSMYRIKALKRKTNEFVPLLVNPDIVACYSENIVDTLHKKNLLMLGEDRFLSTLMLGTFPRRKMVFVPQAICHTTVPDTLAVLKSQRRRWINSSIHNLLELVFLPTLCGTFCLSMNFVIALELFGTVSLPIAIVLTFYLILSSIITGADNLLPLTLLLITLCLPSALILITTRKPIYALWMLVYLVSLPIWNLFLPLFSFWHFDDFSWGDTRKVQGEGKQTDHSGRKGAYQIGSVPLKRWEEWEAERRGLKTRPELPPRPGLPPRPELPPRPRDHKLQETRAQIAHPRRELPCPPSVNVNPNHRLELITTTLDIPSSDDIMVLAPLDVEMNNREIDPKSSLDSRQLQQDLGIPPRKSQQSLDMRIPVNQNNSLHNIPNTSNAFLISSSIASAIPGPSSTNQILQNRMSDGNGGSLLLESGYSGGSAGRWTSIESLKRSESSTKTANSAISSSLDYGTHGRSFNQRISVGSKGAVKEIETSLPVKPGNTINQFWKSLYLDQFEEQDAMEPEMEIVPIVQYREIIVEKQLPPLKIIVAPAAPAKSLTIPNEHPNPYEQSNPPPNEHSGNKNPQTSSSITIKPKPEKFGESRDTLESVSSYATARNQFTGSNLEATEFFSSASPQSSSVHSQGLRAHLQGPREMPWESTGSKDEEFFTEIKIEARTSTPNKSFRDFAKGFNFANLYMSSVSFKKEKRNDKSFVKPPYSDQISGITDISEIRVLGLSASRVLTGTQRDHTGDRLLNEPVLGSREYVPENGYHILDMDRSKVSEKEHSRSHGMNSFKVRGSRPRNF